MSVWMICGTLLAGAGAGLSSAALGVGGGIIMVPAFVHLIPGMELHTAKGTSLLAIVFIAAVNAWRLNRGMSRKVWPAVCAISAGAMASAYAASWLTFHLSGAVLAWGFAALVVLTALQLFGGLPRRVTEEQVRARPGVAAGIGVISGCVSASAGVGGGIIVVPMALAAGIASNAAVSGLSNLVMVPTSIAAVLAHVQAPQIFTGLPGTVGQVNVMLALLAFIGAQAGSMAGMRLNAVLTFRRRRLVMIVLMALVAARMVYYALQG